MTEYIAKKRAQDLIVIAASGNSTRLARVLAKLENEPPADVAPVVHGEWVYEDHETHRISILRQR